MTAMPEPVLSPQVRRTGMTVESHVARDTFAAWGGAVASDMLEWYRKQYGQPESERAAREGGTDWDYLMEEAAAAPPGANGVLFLPHMSGAGCPIVDPHSLGAYVGLGAQATRGSMLRAIIEGLDYQFLEIVRAMESGLGIEMKEFVAVGGSVRNTFWMQNKADVVGRPVQVPAIEEATPLGAAVLAGIGVGCYADEQEAFTRVYRPGLCFEPDTALHAEYRERFALYSQIYPALASLNHQIAHSNKS